MKKEINALAEKHVTVDVNALTGGISTAGSIFFGPFIFRDPEGGYTVCNYLTSKGMTYGCGYIEPAAGKNH